MNKKALIFSPSLEGHRQVYAHYLIEALLNRGNFVNLVSDPCISRNDYPYLTIYNSNPLVQFIEIPNALQFSLQNLKVLQRKLSAELTIFAEADNHLKLLNEQWLPRSQRLIGKNLGIFIRSINYPRLPKIWTNPVNILRFMKHFPANWIIDPVIFHEFTLPKFKLLDAALTLDEEYVDSHLKPYIWLPDIVFPFFPDDPTNAISERQHWEPLLSSFIERNKGREVLLYFGEAQRRKGYDTLLKLACEENCCFVHCGLSSYPEKYEIDINGLKNTLDARGLLFETKAYIQSYSAMKLFFESCHYILFPYRGHFGSSGVMLQSVHFGRPVLVPDQGLMGSRTSRHHLGFNYNPDNYEDLKEKWNQIRESWADFSINLTAYKETFSKEEVMWTLDTILSQVLVQ